MLYPWMTYLVQITLPYSVNPTNIIVLKPFIAILLKISKKPLKRNVVYEINCLSINNAIIVLWSGGKGPKILFLMNNEMYLLNLSLAEK